MSQYEKFLVNIINISNTLAESTDKHDYVMRLSNLSEEIHNSELNVEEKTSLYSKILEEQQRVIPCKPVEEVVDIMYQEGLWTDH